MCYDLKPNFTREGKMQIRHHLSAEQVHHLDTTLGSDWQERSSKKDLLTDELVFEPTRNRRDRILHARKYGEEARKTCDSPGKTEKSEK